MGINVTAQKLVEYATRCGDRACAVQAGRRPATYAALSVARQVKTEIMGRLERMEGDYPKTNWEAPDYRTTPEYVVAMASDEYLPMRDVLSYIEHAIKVLTPLLPEA